MTADNHRAIYWAESAVVLYLVAPLFLFFCFYIRPEVGIPGCGLIAWCIYSIWKKTQWSAIRTDIKSLLIILPISIAWLALGGNFGGLPQNADWLKHYAVINFIAQHSNQLSDTYHGHFEVLREYLGWYLIPGLIVKALNGHDQVLAAGIWTLIGIVLFFALITHHLKRKMKHARLIVPLVFILFSGLDIIGFFLTHHRLEFNVAFWAGWIHYSSNTSSLFWAPEHALPSWLGIAILMRQIDRATLTPYVVLIGSAILFWSPFAMIGLLPFGLAVILKNDAKKIPLNKQTVATLLLITLPLILYLTANTQDILRGWIWENRCVYTQTPCFTGLGYAQFLLIEIGAIVILLFANKETRSLFLVLATGSLMLIPLYRIGFWTDLAKSGSIPALAFLSIGMARLMGSKTTPSIKIIAVVLLAIGIISPICEVGRLSGWLRTAKANPSITFTMPFIWNTPSFLPQYFSDQPIWVLRS